MTPSRSPDTASVTFRTAKQKEEKDLFPYVSVPRFDTSLTVLNEKRSASILSIVWHDGFAARLQQECQFCRVMLFKSWLKNRQCHWRWLPNYMLIILPKIVTCNTENFNNAREKRKINLLVNSDISFSLLTVLKRKEGSHLHWERLFTTLKINSATRHFLKYDLFTEQWVNLVWLWHFTV